MTSDLDVLDAPVVQKDLLEPVARIYGQPMQQLPLDLYIPPDALAVMLDAFEGPLDLLLYLIGKQNIDILDIPVADITRQYMGYVELMKSVRLELAAEELDALPRVGRELHVPQLPAPEARARTLLPQVCLEEVLLAMAEVMRRAELFESHQVTRELLSTRERMSEVLERLAGGDFVAFATLFGVEEGRLGVVVTFMAILELIKESLVELVQNEPFAPIHVRLRGESAAVITQESEPA